MAEPEFVCNGNTHIVIVMRACVRACVHASERACVQACVRAHVFVQIFNLLLQFVSGQL